MKNSLFVLFFAALASAAIVSCTKEKLQVPTQEENPLVQVRTDTEYPANANNPYDYYGLVHNQAVDAYIAAGGTKENAGNLKKVVDMSNQLLLEATDYSEYFSGGTLVSVGTLSPFTSDFPDNMEDIIEAGEASDEVKAKMSTFINYFLEVTEGEEIVYDDLYEYIIDFETEILVSKSWSSEEREQLLSATSIGRYSLYYWYTADQAEGFSKGFSTTNNQERRKWWQWVIVGVADVGGAYLGGVSGAIAGSNFAHDMTDESNK